MNLRKLDLVQHCKWIAYGTDGLGGKCCTPPRMRPKLHLPGPFYLIALGDIGQADYSQLAELGLILFFNVIMLLMVEVPMIGYLFNPEATDRRVGQFAAWLNRNGMRIVGTIATLWGASLLGKGLRDILG
jgi:hypothetical protein